MKFLSFQQGSQDWLEYRKTKVTATDCAIIMGIDEYVTPYERWQQKVGIVPEQYVTAAMQRGHDLEDKARDAYTQFTGEPMAPACIESMEWPFLMASLDGINPDGTLVVEIKCPKEWKWKEVPKCYWCQCQHHMLCTGHSMSHIWPYSGEEGILFEVQRDQPFLDKYLVEAKKFYECVVHRIPPPLTQRDLTHREDDLWKKASEDWINAKRKLKEAEECELEAREVLKTLSGDQSTEGCGIRLRRSIAKGRVDYESIPELKHIDIELYRKPETIKWTITESNLRENGISTNS